MIRAHEKQIYSEVRQLVFRQKDAAKKALRASLREAMRVSWDVIHKAYPSIPKQKQKGKIRSFKQRTVQSIRTNEPQSATIRMENSQFSMIHTVIGNKHEKLAHSPIKEALTRKRKFVRRKSVKRKRTSKFQKPVRVKVHGQRKTIDKGFFIASPRKLRSKEVTQVFWRRSGTNTQNNQTGKYNWTKLGFSPIAQLILDSINQKKLMDAAATKFHANFEKSIHKGRNVF